MSSQEEGVPEAMVNYHHDLEGYNGNNNNNALLFQFNNNDNKIKPISSGGVGGGVKKGGRVPGSKGYSESETFCLLDLVSQLLPKYKAAVEWDLLTRQYNAIAVSRGWTNRDADSLRGRFHRLVHHSKKNNDPDCPRVVLRARQINSLMENGSGQSRGEDEDSESGTCSDGIPRPVMPHSQDSSVPVERSSSKKRNYSTSSSFAGELAEHLNPKKPARDSSTKSPDQSREAYCEELEKQNMYYQTINEMLMAQMQLQKQQYQLQLEALMQANIRLWNMVFNPFVNNSAPVSPMTTGMMMPPQVSKPQNSEFSLQNYTLQGSSKPVTPDPVSSMAVSCVSPADESLHLFSTNSEPHHSLELSEAETVE